MSQMAHAEEGPTKNRPVYKFTNAGFTIRGWYGQEPGDDGRILIEHVERGILHDFACPGYRIWNYAAHFPDIVAAQLTAQAIREQGIREGG